MDSRLAKAFVAVVMAIELLVFVAFESRGMFMSALPGRIVLDLPVDLPRPWVPEGENLELLRLRLLEKNPQLLAGLAA